MAANTATQDALRASFVGKTLDDVPTPAAVLDLAKAETNCQRMLDAVTRLGLGWRAHIKTHKTTELTRLQVGDGDSTPVNLVVSTLVEAENIVPLLQEYQGRGRAVNLLYSFPLFPSAVPRLARVAASLGPGGLSVMVDHVGQVELLAALAGDARPLVFLKIDMGYHRAGVEPGSEACAALARALGQAHAAGHCVFHGLYCHAGNSYDTRSDWAALDYLAAEFRALLAAAAAIGAPSSLPPLTLSVGATPTATTLQHPAFADAAGGEAATAALRGLLADVAAAGLRAEVHAGVYPLLDMQQLATHARSPALLGADDVALSVLAEVASLYPGRGPAGTTEALTNAGCLALGREPCRDLGDPPGRDYAAWGWVAPWRVDNPVPGPAFPAVHGGWQVGRISQEHGMLVWMGPADEATPLAMGQRVRLWPNHACIAGAGFDHYFVVDSRLAAEGRQDEIVDVWVRWRGW